MNYRNCSVVLLAGGVGGARMARGLAKVLDPDALTVVVNVGDDDRFYGVHVAADVDTMLYTLAGIEGPQGWGIAGDTFTFIDRLAALGVDTRFRLGDRDYAFCSYRTRQLDDGVPLSATVDAVAASLGVVTTVRPATDDRLRTRIKTSGGEWLDFQEYFVIRRYEPEIAELAFEGAGDATPAPGVVEAIDAADLVVIAPSNPPLSIWPILAVGAIGDAVRRARRVVGVSPLIGGSALKGPADRVMAALGLPAGTAGVLEAYVGLLTDLFVHHGDRAERDGVAVRESDILIQTAGASERLAKEILASL